MTVRVVLADDQALVRAGFKVLVDIAPGLEVVGEAANGREAIELAQALKPDVVLMDIRMPDLDGLAATRQITEALPLTKVLILTTFEIDEYILAALRAGASGFLGKGVEPEEVQDAIRLVAQGDALLSQAATRALIARFLDGPVPLKPAQSLEDLTDRECEAMKLVACGLSNDEIAARMQISPHTAKTHVNRAMAKLGAHDRAQLVIMAYETGLVKPGS